MYFGLHLTACVDPFSQIDFVLTGGPPWCPDVRAALTAWEAWSFRPFRTAHAARGFNFFGRRRRKSEETHNDAEAPRDHAANNNSPPEHTHGPGDTHQPHHPAEYYITHPWGDHELGPRPKAGPGQPAQDPPEAQARPLETAPGGAIPPLGASENETREHIAVDIEALAPTFEMEGAVGLAPWPSADNPCVRRTIWPGDGPSAYAGDHAHASTRRAVTRRYPHPAPGAYRAAPPGYPRPVSWPPAAPSAQPSSEGREAVARRHPHLAHGTPHATRPRHPRPASWPSAGPAGPPPPTPPTPGKEQ